MAAGYSDASSCSAPLSATARSLCAYGRTLLMQVSIVGLVLQRHRGDEVVGADGGPAGIAKAQVVMPELIVLDLMMPVLDGYQVYSRLRSLPGLESTPILFVGAREPELVYPP